MSLFSRFRPSLLAAFILIIAGTCSFGATHTIRKGDTLYSLARTHKTTVKSIMAANGIKDPTRLKIGRRLVIPSKSSRPTSRKTYTRPSTSKKSTPSSPRSSYLSNTGRGKRVIIDPGHGGKDWGAYKGGIKESYLNMRVAQKLEYYLKRRGYSTAMTRRSDTFISLSRRAAFANRYRNAIFVSIHFNSTRSSYVRGIETFYAGSRGRALANCVQRELINKCRARNRGVRFARFAVLTQTRCPAVLVECGFISNATERARCKSNSYQTQLAVAIADGISKYRW